MMVWLMTGLIAVCAVGIWWTAYVVNRHLYELRIEQREDLHRVSNAVAHVVAHLDKRADERRKKERDSKPGSYGP